MGTVGFAAFAANAASFGLLWAYRDKWLRTPRGGGAAPKIILDYAEACFERSPILKQLIVNRTADALELTNGITLEVRPASFRKLRGPTYVAVIADELAFWLDPERS